jgi:hypothetical protein
MFYTTLLFGSKSPNNFAGVLFYSSYILEIGLKNSYKTAAETCGSFAK